MKYSKILLCMMVFVCFAFQACAQDPLGAGSSGSTMGSSGDYISPDMGVGSSGSTMGSSGDYISPDMDVGSSRGTNPDEGLAGMLQWLNEPVPNFPWYSSSEAFYNQAVPDTTFSPFTEYYATTGTPVEDGIVSNPTRFNITEKTPTSVYYGAGVGLPYSQYASIVPSKTNDLWIQGAANWTQYVASPVGTWIQLVANAPVGGPAGFYEMIQTNTTSSKYKTYEFNQGYNTMNFQANQVGRHMLYFVVDSQPSNVVVVDVFAQESPENATASINPATNQTPATADMPAAGNTLVTTPSITDFLKDDWTTPTQLETSGAPYKLRQMN